MNLRRSDEFREDFRSQYEWYFLRAGEDVAERFFEKLESTLLRLMDRPALGRTCNYSHLELQDLRLFRVEHPFEDILIFYRFTDGILTATRLMHGSRDLPRRLNEPPGA